MGCCMIRFDLGKVGKDCTGVNGGCFHKIDFWCHVFAFQAADVVGSGTLGMILRFVVTRIDSRAVIESRNLQDPYRQGAVNAEREKRC